MSDSYRNVLLIGGSKSGKTIDIKNDHNFFSNVVRKNYDDDPYIEEYAQYQGLHHVFFHTGTDIQKCINIIQELIFQGLRNGS